MLTDKVEVDDVHCDFDDLCKVCPILPSPGFLLVKLSDQGA